MNYQHAQLQQDTVNKFNLHSLFRDIDRLLRQTNLVATCVYHGQQLPAKVAGQVAKTYSRFGWKVEYHEGRKDKGHHTIFTFHRE